MRYIGSKERLLTQIETIVLDQIADGTQVADLFCGTASVSGLFKRMGYQITANDNLYFSSVIAEAVLNVSSEPEFRGLSNLETMLGPSDRLFSLPYDNVLRFLNLLQPIEGFMFGEYSLDGTAGLQYERRYFSGWNAGRIDAIRCQIEKWNRDCRIDNTEGCLLISDLLRAAARVANTAGTFGYFMKTFESRARQPLMLDRSAIIPGNCNHNILNVDALNLAKDLKVDFVYIDPPYNWRQYAAYYHILETIARWDGPNVVGKSGLRDWKEQRSRFSIRSEARGALEELISDLNVRKILLSYASEGILRHEILMDILGNVGNVKAFKTSLPRYSSSKGRTGATIVEERLYYVEKH